MLADPAPCPITFSDSMRELHRWIMGVGSVTALMTLGVLLDRLRMMWGDYRRKHHIDGGREV